MRSVIARQLGAVVSVVLLAGCGGGGGGGAGTVALKSEQDVIREISNLSGLYVDGSGGPAPASSMSGPRQSGLKRLATNTRAMYPRAKSTRPKAAVTADCQSGGTYTYEDFFETARALPLFAANPVMDYTVGTDRDCEYVDGAYREFYDGYYEYGGNFAYTEGTAETPQYDYDVAGSGSTPYREIFEDTDFDEKFTFKSLGRYEGRDNGVTFESREVFDFDLTFAAGGESINVGAKAGESGNPFVFVDNYNGDGSVSVDGPIRYSSDFCDSGRVDYTTVQNLTFGDDPTYGTIINGGELLIESGSASVTLVFQSDGGVTYTFGNGDTGVVTLEELNANAEECVFFPGVG